MSMIYSVACAEGTAATVDRAGRVVGAYRAPVTGEDAFLPLSRPQTVAGPQGAVRHPVCAVYRHPVGILAPGTWVRLWHDVLAAAGGVAGRRGVATAARDVARRTTGCGQARLVQGGGRQLPSTSDEGRPKTGPSPVDRAKTGSKHHVITDGAGIPLAILLTGGNRHDVTQLLNLLDAIPPVHGKRGRPKRRPTAVYADRAYDSNPHRTALNNLGITPHLARKGTKHGSGLGVHRWVVEQTIALLHWFRRLRIRWEIRDDIHEAFMSIACSIICYRRLTT